MRSGNTDIGSEKIWLAGRNGYWWSATANSNTKLGGYYFYFEADRLSPSDGNIRFYGFPLRCLSTAIDM